MDIYKELYYYLFNAITDAAALIEQGGAEFARKNLLAAQLAAEEKYLAAKAHEDR